MSIFFMRNIVLRQKNLLQITVTYFLVYRMDEVVLKFVLRILFLQKKKN